MIKKSFIAICAILLLVISILSAMQVELVDANPVPWQSTPNTEKPTLIIKSPQNYSTYSANSSIYFNITAISPASWNATHMGVVHYIGGMGQLKVYIDNNLLPWDICKTNVSIDRSISSASFWLNQTALGQHILNVTVESLTLYHGPPYNNTHILSSIASSSGPVYEYPIVVSDIVYFTKGQQSAPTPTQTSNPTPTTPYLPPNDRNAPHLEPTFYLLPISVIIAIIVIAIIIYRRGRPASMQSFL